VKRKTTVLTIMAIAVIAAATLITVNTQSQTRNLPQQKSESEIPIADINSPQFQKDENRNIRISRGEKYNTGHPLEDIFPRPQWIFSNCRLAMRL
jgi:hypothetical protein